MAGGAPPPSSNATRSVVGDAVTDTLLLAVNRSRKGATIYNGSTAILYLGLGSAAVTTGDYTIEVAAEGYYEMPYNFQGMVRGIWASDAGGSAFITELT